MSYELDGQRRSIANGLLYHFHARYSIVGPRVVWEANVQHEAEGHSLFRGAAMVACGQSEEGAATAVLSEVCSAIDLPRTATGHTIELS